MLEQSARYKLLINEAHDLGHRARMKYQQAEKHFDREIFWKNRLEKYPDHVRITGLVSGHESMILRSRYLAHREYYDKSYWVHGYTEKGG